MTAIPKPTRIKLHGKALRDLNDAVFTRDNHCCIACGAWVPDGQKFHHEPCGINKSDELKKAALLCLDCHHKRHFTDEGPIIKAFAQNYLDKINEKEYENAELA